ncbi:ornithine cyclodeaminase family protein [Amycolatopsis decaplanina]|uniref:Ornithine cyclodeaminase n=1 Tax=Amycolatopsis decaplanina DSM 44594 TaxID=1284240 RepID=M2YCC9_9PSEU|nr:ornithine cyclodeaminase family protein [Amycolatopsis decaplanina]EME52517.1 ornithine cyclodeaminase [Amycolatopsis decaplanina DSM 44594]
MENLWLADVLARPVPESVRFLSRADVLDCLARVDVVAAVRDALVSHHLGRTILPSEAYLSWTNQHGAYSRSIGMPGAILEEGAEGAYGMKIINASVSNPEFGLERAGGLGLCFDPRTARVIAVMEVGVLSAVRTAAVTAIAVETAGYQAVRSLAVVGCGTQARVHLALLLTRCPELSRITLCDVRRPVAENLAGELASRHPGISFSVAATPVEAMDEAETTLFLTTVAEGYVQPDWVRPGSLLVNVSLGDLTDEVLVNASALFVDDVQLIVENPRRPLGRLVNEGRIAAKEQEGQPSITATIGELLAGETIAQRPDTGYVVVNPFGLGILDVALFGAVLRQANSADIGQALELV